MSAQGNTASPRVRKAVACAFVGAMALLATACPFSGGAGADQQTIAIAIRTDGGSPAVTVALGDPYDFEVGLPAGEYYEIAVNGDGMPFDLGIVEEEEGSSFAWGRFSGGESDPELAAALGTVAALLTDIELLRLDVLEVASDGFAQPLFSSSTEIDAAEFEDFYNEYLALAALEDDVTEALAEIEPKLQARAYASTRLASPPAGVLDRLADSVLPDFFNRVRKLPERERVRVNEIIAEIGAGDQQDLFDRLPANLRGDASSFEEWRDAVQSGQLDQQLGAIHGYLQVSAPDATSSSGHTLGRSVAQEGGPLLDSGTDLLVKAYGKVPHVSKVIDVTKKAREWEGYVRKLYNDPDAGVKDILRGPYQKLVKDRVKADLRKSWPDAPDKVIDLLAAQLAKQLVSVLAGKPAAVVAAAGGGTSGSGPAPASTMETAESPEWIEVVVEAIAQRLLRDGFSGIEAAVVTDDLRVCLLDAVSQGLGRDDALSACAYIIEHAEATPTPDAAPEATPCPSVQTSDGVATMDDLTDGACPTPVPPTPVPPTPEPPTVAPAPTVAPPPPPPAAEPTCASFDPACGLRGR